MDNKIQEVVEATNCGRHAAPNGTPCFYIPGKDRDHNGICNARAKKAGFVGVISKHALSRGGRR